MEPVAPSKGALFSETFGIYQQNVLNNEFEQFKDQDELKSALTEVCKIFKFPASPKTIKALPDSKDKTSSLSGR